MHNYLVFISSAIRNDKIKIVLFLTFSVLNLVVLNNLLEGSTEQQQLQERSTYHLTDGAPASTATTSTTSSFSGNCMNLNFEENMDTIISNSRPVFITMPAKAAGSSLKTFTNKCMKNVYTDNFLNHRDQYKNFLTWSYKLPTIISSHLYNPTPLIHLIEQSTRKTLILYIHRDETERVKSGIEHYFMERVCKVHIHIERNETHCTVEEAQAIAIIQTRKHEIGTGAHDILTCDTFKAIEENAPNIVFMHYKQASRLQKLIAKHHCPDLLKEPPIMINTVVDKSLEMYLRLKDDTTVVKLDAWLKEKIGFLEWSLELKRHASCQAKIRHMEDHLFACPDQTLKISSSDIKSW